jgi:hypothetical protein
MGAKTVFVQHKAVSVEARRFPQGIISKQASLEGFYALNAGKIGSKRNKPTKRRCQRHRRDALM